MQKKQFWLLIGIIVLTLAAGIFCFPQYVNNAIDAVNSKLVWKLPHIPQNDFKFGLDVKGGVQLQYQADLSSVPDNEKSTVMAGVRDLIERRVNVYGVSEPQIQTSGVNRLIVELPGISDIQQAIDWIGQTPYLQFAEERDEAERQKILDKIEEVQNAIKTAQDNKTDEQTALMSVKDYQLAFENPYYKNTELTGKHLKKASLSFNPTTGAPEVELQFNDEGAKIFEGITGRNVGKTLAIYLDGKSIIDTNGDDKIDDNDLYAPRINEKISAGRAVITGITNVVEAKTLVTRLNEGALPVPLGQPISQQLIGPTLGALSFEKTVRAGIIGFLLVIIFIICYYRLPGLLASLALSIYVILLLAVFKLFGVTMSLAAIGGFILSVGMAVDANVLIFSRMKEEIDAGKSLIAAVEKGFSRAWPAIRDGNFTTIVVGVILYFLGTSFVKGFATTLIIGIFLSMFSAIIVTRTFLRVLAGTKLEKIKWLWRALA